MRQDPDATKADVDAHIAAGTGRGRLTRRRCSDGERAELMGLTFGPVRDAEGDDCLPGGAGWGAGGGRFAGRTWADREVEVER